MVNSDGKFLMQKLFFFGSLALPIHFPPKKKQENMIYINY